MWAWAQDRPRLSDGVVEHFLELGLAGEQIAERELQLAGPAALGSIAVQPALEKRILVRQVGEPHRCKASLARPTTTRAF